MGEIYNDINQNGGNDVSKMVDNLLSVGSLVKRRNDIKFRDIEIKRLYNIMDKSAYRSVLLVGDSGSGKRSIIEGYVDMICNEMRSDQVIELDFNELIKKAQNPDANYLQMIQDIFYVCSHNTSFDITLVINNIGHILNLNCFGNGGFTFLNMLIKYIENDNMRVIATATTEEYKTIEDSFQFLIDYFTVIKPAEINQEQSMEILEDILPDASKFYSIKLPSDTCELICANADKYIKEIPFPKKAEMLLDEVCASISNKYRTVDSEAVETAKRRASLVDELGNCMESGDFDRCNEIEDELLDIDSAGLGDDIDEVEASESDVLEAIGDIVGVNMSKINKDKTEFLREMPVELKKRVMGQDDTIDTIVKNIRRNQLGLRKTRHSAGNFMFIGSTGVGKTYLAKQLAKYLYGSEENMLRLDMSEFQTEIDVSKLLGSAPGYVGYGESGLLVRGLAKKPETVLLFDEIEKAHPKIYDVLLQLLDEGFVTGSNGKKVDASKALIIFTSNIGVKQASEMSSPLGFSTDIEKNKNEKKEKIIRKALKNRFSPEFLNRLDNICYFNPLDRETLKSILHKELDEMNVAIKSITGKTVELSNDVEEWIIANVEKEDNGARPIIRLLQQKIEESISDMIINEDKALKSRKHTLVAKLENEEIIIK